VTAVLVTGMSGTGKSSALAELARRGHRVVDTDYGGWTEREAETLWREYRIDQLLDEHEDGVLFVSGCVANQGKFYPRFDAVVLLSAPADVILERVAGRSTNDFGKIDSERERILSDLAAVEPLLRRGATAEIDTRAPLTEVVDALERIASQTTP
jgi:dephospho-CoA kinase